MTTEDNINRFCSWFREELTRIDSLRCADGAEAPPRFRTALYFMVIDALSKVRYHGESLGNRDRFIRVIREHATWPIGERVSAVVLRRRLGPACCTPLAKHLDGLVGPYEQPAGGTIQPGGPIDVAAIDPEAAELLKIALRDEDGQIENTRHVSLLYRHRSFLVHELRPPGYAIEAMAARAKPFYHGYVGESELQLGYPAPFVRWLAYTVLDSLNKWFKVEIVDPYTRVEESSSW